MAEEEVAGTAVSPVPTVGNCKFEDLQPESTKEQPLESNTDGGETNADEDERPRLDHKGEETLRMKFPIEKTGSIVGREGATLKFLWDKSGASIEFNRDDYMIDGLEKVTLEIKGEKQQVEKAKVLLNEIVNQPTVPIPTASFSELYERWRNILPVPPLQNGQLPPLQKRQVPQPYGNGASQPTYPEN